MATPTPIDVAAVSSQVTTTAAPYIPLVIVGAIFGLVGTLFVALRKVGR